MKTPVQQIIEDLQDMCPDYYNRNYNWLHSLLEMEKQRIIDAHNNGKNILPPNENGEQYYNQTFNK